MGRSNHTCDTDMPLGCRGAATWDSSNLDMKRGEIQITNHRDTCASSSEIFVVKVTKNTKSREIRSGARLVGGDQFH